MSHVPPHASGPIVRQSPASLDEGFYYIVYLGKEIPEADHNTTGGFLIAGNDGLKRPYGPEVAGEFNKLALRLRVQEQTAGMRWTSWASLFPQPGQFAQTLGYRAFIGTEQVVYETATANGTVIDKAWTDPNDGMEKWRKMELVDWTGSTGTKKYFISDDLGVTWTEVSLNRWTDRDGFFDGTASLINVSITGNLAATLAYDDPDNRYSGSLDFVVSGATQSLDTNVTLAESEGFPSPGNWASRHPGVWLSYRRNAIPEQSYESRRSKFRVELFLDPIPSTIGSHRITGRMIRRKIPQGLVEMNFDHYPAGVLPKADRSLTRQGTVTLSDEVLHPSDKIGSLAEGDPSWNKFGFQWWASSSMSLDSNTDRSYYRIAIKGNNGPYTVTWDIQGTASTTSFSEVTTHQGAFWRTALRYSSSPIGLEESNRLTNIVVTDANGVTLPAPSSGAPEGHPWPDAEKWKIEYKNRRGWLGFKDFTQYGFGTAGVPIRYFRQRDATYEVNDSYSFKTGTAPSLAEYPATGYRRTITTRDIITPGEGPRTSPNYSREVIATEAELTKPGSLPTPVVLDSTFNPPVTPDSAEEITDPTSLSIDRPFSALNIGGVLFGVGYIPRTGNNLATSAGDEISSTWFDEVATKQTIDGVDQIVTPEMETPFIGYHEMIRLEDVVVRPAPEPSA